MHCVTERTGHQQALLTATSTQGDMKAKSPRALGCTTTDQYTSIVLHRVAVLPHSDGGVLIHHVCIGEDAASCNHKPRATGHLLGFHLPWLQGGGRGRGDGEERGRKEEEGGREEGGGRREEGGGSQHVRHVRHVGHRQHQLEGGGRRVLCDTVDAGQRSHKSSSCPHTLAPSYMTKMGIVHCSPV